jgi:hypothetical protein
VSTTAEREVEQLATGKASADTAELTRWLFRTVLGILAVLALVLVSNLWVQYSTYHAALDRVNAAMSVQELTATVVLAKAWDFAVVKTCSLFLAFTLIFVGALYVLRQGDQAYQASFGSGGMKATLQSSSPGLVLATLGVALVIAALFATSTIQIEQQPATNQRPQAQERGATMDAR